MRLGVRGWGCRSMLHLLRVSILFIDKQFKCRIISVEIVQKDTQNVYEFL